MKKNISKRILPAVLSGLVLTGAMAGCTTTGTGTATGGSEASTIPSSVEINTKGLPLVKEKQTITIGTALNDANPSNGTTKFMQMMEEETNVKVEWVETLLSAWPEKKNILLASNDQPDAYMGVNNFSESDVLNFGSSGKFIPIQGYIDEYMPNLKGYLDKNPNWKKAITAPDGNIYGVPDIYSVGAGHFDAANIPFINQKWIDKVNLSFKFDPNVSMTLDQFKEVLVAFKTQDPNGNGKADEIPWSSLSKNLFRWGASFGFYGGALDAGYNYMLNVKDGKVGFAAMDPGFKEFVAWLNGLWKEGLMDPETFTQSNQIYLAKVKNTDDFIGYSDNWRLGSMQYGAEDDRWVFNVPLTAPNHPAAWVREQSMQITRGGFVVTSSAKNPALCLAWADNLLTPDNSLSINTSQVFGEHIEKQADGTYKQLRPIDWNRPDEASFMISSKLFILTADTFQKQLTLPVVAIQKDPIDKALQPYFQSNIAIYPNAVWLDNNDTKEINNYLTEIKAYIDSTFANWVTVGGVEKDWDEYIKTLDNMGAQKAIDIYQKYYDKVK